MYIRAFFFSLKAAAAARGVDQSSETEPNQGKQNSEVKDTEKPCGTERSCK